MGTTPTHSLPYPEPSAMADVPADIRLLAAAVDAAIPTGAVDAGQMILASQIFG